jgi:outer membrane protein assembly factor BamB
VFVKLDPFTMKRMAIIFLLLLPVVPRAADFTAERLDNWHQWRGPNANGSSPNGDPPTAWDAKKNIKWKAAIPGRGSATPIIWGDKVFILTAIDTGREAKPEDLPKLETEREKKTKAPMTYHQFVVLCLDRATGKERWRKVAAERVPHEGHHPTHSYAAGSPTTDGKYLYASFGSFGIYCYDLKGKLQWQRDLGLMQTRLGWGEGTSPVLHGDALIVNWDHEAGSFIACLDAKTGKTRWKVDRDEVTSWATPLVVEHKGRTQVIVMGTKRVRGYDLANGKLLWQAGGLTVNCIPSPVVWGNSVICMSGYRGSAAYALPLDVNGDVSDGSKVLWKYNRGTPYVPSPLLAGDRLYFTERNEAILTCLEVKTGKAVIDRERLPGLHSLYSSPVCAAGRIYLADRDGTTLVFKRGDKLEILAINKLGESIDASPAVVGKQLFLRGEKHLYCIEEK